MKFIKCDNNTTKFQGSLSTYNMINVAENLFIPITILKINYDEKCVINI